MVSEYLKPQEESVFTSNDLAAMQTVFDALKVHIVYQDHPEKLHDLARSIFTAYKTTSKDPNSLIRILRYPSRTT
jgi:hypothetical protein